MEFSDWELEVLDEILVDEVDRNHDEPTRTSADYVQTTSDLFSKVRDEAKRRKLWWAR